MTIRPAAKWIGLMLIALTIGILATLAQRNWLCHAWLSLATKGHLHVQFKEPSQGNTGVHPHIFVSKLVYSDGTYLGYIDPYGNFVGRTEDGIDLDREGRITVFLYAAQAISLLILFSGAIGVFWTLLRSHRHFLLPAAGPHNSGNVL